MLQKLQTKTMAWLITICAILLAVLLGGRSSLLVLRTQAAEVFYAEDGNAYTSLDYDLEEVLGESRNLCAVAARYVEADSAMMSKVQERCDILERAKGPAAKYSAANELRSAVEDLDMQLGVLPLSETDRLYHTKLIANIESRYATIANNSYNQAAVEFNSELQRFPAKLLASITGVKPLELYA